MAVASGEGSAHDLTPLERRRAWIVGREDEGRGTMADIVGQPRSPLLTEKRNAHSGLSADWCAKSRQNDPKKGQNGDF